MCICTNTHVMGVFMCGGTHGGYVYTCMKMHMRRPRVPPTRISFKAESLTRLELANSCLAKAPGITCISPPANCLALSMKLAQPRVIWERNAKIRLAYGHVWGRDLLIASWYRRAESTVDSTVPRQLVLNCERKPAEKLERLLSGWALTALPADQNLVLITHIAAHNCL